MNYQFLFDIGGTLIVVLGSVFAGAGFWQWLSRKSDKKSATTKLMLGLAHNQIVTQGMTYLERGYVSKDEYEDFIKYLYEPYSEFGGNGLAEKIMKDVSALPIRNRIQP